MLHRQPAPPAPSDRRRGKAQAAAIAYSIPGTAATYELSRLPAPELSKLAAHGRADPASLGPIKAECRAGCDDITRPGRDLVRFWRRRLVRSVTSTGSAL